MVAGFLVTLCQICSAVPSPGKDGDVAPLVPSASIDINNDFKLYDETQHIPGSITMCSTFIELIGYWLVYLIVLISGSYFLLVPLFVQMSCLGGVNYEIFMLMM